jgi:hypothetical protein
VVDDGEAEELREVGEPALVRGLRSVLREVQEMKTATNREKAQTAMRRGVHHLIRHCAIYQHTFAAIRFSYEISERALACHHGDAVDYELAAAKMERLSETTPSDVPLWYYALASDLFDWCARKLARADAREKKKGPQIVEPMDTRDLAHIGTPTP